MENELKLMDVHECEAKLPKGISIEKYKRNHNSVWYHRNGNVLNAIIYCPFCGKRLGI